MRTSVLACLGGGAGVVEGGAGVSALFGLDDRDVGALGPDLQLLDGGGAEGVGGAEQDGAALGAEEGGELAGGGGLAGAVDADHHDDFGGRGGMVDGLSYAVEDLLQLGFEELLELVAALDAGAESALAKVFEDEGGGGAADVGGEQDGFEAGEGGLVDLAGEGDDGADGLGEGLAGAGDRLLHAVEEAALLLGRFGGGRSLRGGGGLVGLLLGFVAFAEERKCHADASLAMARDWAA